MTKTLRTWLVRGAILVVIVGVALGAWLLLKPTAVPSGVVSGNGRIEAVEIDVSTKLAGRLGDIVVNEGDTVKAGQVVAHMGTQVLQAQRAEASAQLDAAITGILTAQSQVVQRASERASGVAVVEQRRAAAVAAGKRLARSETLSREGAAAVQDRDDDQATAESAQAAVSAARAQVDAATAAIATARSQVVSARSNAEAVRATIRRIDADILDSALRAPAAGRVQYRVAQPGEVLAAGGKVLNLVNLGDVYMTFFLPESVAGKVALGSEVRLVLDAAPDTVIPARVSFVADVAQFTPKTVETASEREKLMFRVKARIDPALLQRHIAQVKTGLPGMAYVRIDPAAAWPTTIPTKLAR